MIKTNLLYPEGETAGLQNRLIHYSIRLLENQIKELDRQLMEKERLYRQEEANNLTLLKELAIIPGCESLEYGGYYSESLDEALDWIKQQVEKEKEAKTVKDNKQTKGTKNVRNTTRRR